MKKFSILLTLSFLFALLMNCLAGLAFVNRGVPVGFAYTESVSNEKILISSEAAKKRGEACAKSYLGLYTAGDASLSKAMDVGRISKLYFVDQKYNQILGVVAEYCLVAYGE